MPHYTSSRVGHLIHVLDHDTRPIACQNCFTIEIVEWLPILRIHSNKIFLHDNFHVSRIPIVDAGLPENAFVRIEIDVEHYVIEQEQQIIQLMIPDAGDNFVC